MDLEIDEARLREEIEANAAFGDVDAEEGRGRTVRTATEADRRARERLVDRLEGAGLDVRVDAVGNIAGTWTPPSADPEAAPVAVGSHLDSVPEGGIFDGPLGVYGALESVRAMREAGADPERPVTVVSFTEEEGTRFTGLLGSSVAAGNRTVEEALADRDGEGTTLEEALEDVGFRGEGRLDASAWEGWYELHVEQQTRLEAADVPVGVVTTITGISTSEATVVGEANHAGATPMDERSDALCAAAEFVLDVEDAANDVVATSSETAVGTVGSLDVSPNASNVVPGRIEMGVDVRDIDHDSMDTVIAAARESLDRIAAERGVETSFERGYDLHPTGMSDRLREAAHAAGTDAGVGTMDLHSGAAHDTMHVADVTDASLLFAPSRDGVSHSPREWTDWADCATATRVLAGAVAALAGAD